ncbi:MAG TPA: bifunctional folylpolyglutamate synthase/dihydrofolate synthase [Deltaproteobacteria bacterium]|nr:bifunctional folylpolyglutamate synthase/dihydrofolate synthase [Deltaproteobacteria bacterium]
MNYQQAWTFLDNLQFFKIKLGLDSMNRFLEDVGQPHQDLKFIHVAGTNGKGSMSSTLLSILSKAGYRVGLYTSPHLSSVRERFRINDQFIPEDDFAELATRIRDVLGDRQITYFEFTTALALLWFARQKVDLVILEVGMGGRLDATNVITPQVGVITNVSMDHEAYLGNTLAAVAGEKAGIIKPGVPIVSGVGADDSLTVVEQTCRDRGAPLYLLGRDFTVEPGDAGSWSYLGLTEKFKKINGLRHGLIGRYQRDNGALALAVLEQIAADFPVDEEHIRAGLAEVRWPGRLEYFCMNQGGRVVGPEAAADNGVRRYLLDGAHNPAGVDTLKEALAHDFTYGRLILVWASMADKDMKKTLSTMAPLADIIVLTMPESERSATPVQLREILAPAEQGKARIGASIEAALATAAAEAQADDLICVAGSLYLVGKARKILLGEVVA